MKSSFNFIAFMLLSFSGCFANLAIAQSGEEQDKLQADVEQKVAMTIKQNFESHLFQLPPRIQGHYGIRLFRMTGEEKYLPSALYDYYVIVDRLHRTSYRLNHPGYVMNKSKALTDAMSHGKRGKARRKALKKHPEFIFYADELLRYLSRMNEFGVEIPPLFMNKLKSYDFLPGLTDKTMIRAWAAQLANYVYWLKELGIADYRDEYKHAFTKAYKDVDDDSLTNWHFRNKLYGLTHFVFAASNYYQQYVSEEELGWVLDYFRANQSRIFEVASADIIAEIGISFELMQQGDDPMVAKTKQKLVDAFDWQAGMIPSVSGKIDYATGEHRNVLAYMLFTWPEKLHRGPHFKQIESMRKYLPTHSFDTQG